MSTTTRLGRLFGFGLEECIRECRHCGTTLENKESHCTACGSDSIASYEL